MESRRSDIVRTDLQVPSVHRNPNTQPNTASTTISGVIGPSEALQQESQSRQLTAQVHQDREKKQQQEGFTRGKPDKRGPKQKGRAQHQHQRQHHHHQQQRPHQPRQPYQQYQQQQQQQPGSWQHIDPRARYQVATIPHQYQSGSVQARPGLFAPTRPVYLAPVQMPRPNYPVTMPAAHPSYLAPFQNQAQVIMPATYYQAAKHPVGPPAPVARPGGGTNPGHRKMTSSTLEAEYDRSRGAYFSNLPPQPEIKIGNPSTGVVTLSRSDIVSMRAEVAEVGAMHRGVVDEVKVTKTEEVGKQKMERKEKEEEVARSLRPGSLPALGKLREEGGTREPVNARGWNIERVERVERRMREAEWRMERVEEKLDRVLEAQEGMPGPAMVAGGMEGWWKEVKEEG